MGERDDYVEPGDRGRRSPLWRIAAIGAALIWGTILAIWFVETFVHKVRE
jgi:hypothetical protein